MNRFYAYISAIALVSCTEWAPQSIQVDRSEQENMPPIGYTTVSAADYGGTLPVAELNVPDDGTEIIAADIRNYETAFLAQSQFLTSLREVEYVYTDQPTPSLAPVITAPNTIASASWADTSIKIDIPNCAIGDDLKIRVWGSWQLNTVSSPTTVGRARVGVILDPLGAPLVVPNVYGIATISDDSGALTVPHNENYAMEYRYRVTQAGTVRAIVQAKYEDLSGGVGTATLVFLHSARMDITHVKRNSP